MEPDAVTEPTFDLPDRDREAHLEVREDVVRGLDEWFEPADGDAGSAWAYRADLERAGVLGNGQVVVVAWRYRADPRPSVWGGAAERGPVEIDGVTFVDLEADDGTRYSRYIDWHDVFTQLGVAAAGHLVV